MFFSYLDSLVFKPVSSMTKHDIVKVWKIVVYKLLKVDNVIEFNWYDEI